MTVGELIIELLKLDPDLEVWRINPYAQGVGPINYSPREEVVLVDPTGKAKPRFSSHIRYETNPDRWSETLQRVAVL